jgi:ParB family chromosome partitioning protein
MAGIDTIPAIVREVPEQQVPELTLIENIQREDLDPIETAEAFARLASDSALTHEQIATRTGKDRATVTNFLRLLKLPADVRERVAAGQLSMGHARALLALPSEAAQRALATRIVAQGLSVRQTEALVKSHRSEPLDERSKGPKPDVHIDPNVSAAIQEIERVLGTRVRIIEKGNRGKIEIEYYSQEDLDRIYEAIVKA